MRGTRTQEGEVVSQPTDACRRCGQTEGVAVVSYVAGTRERSEVLCPDCKGSILVRERVKRRSKRTSPESSRRLLLAITLACVALLALLALLTVLTPDDPDPCRLARPEAACQPS